MKSRTEILVPLAAIQAVPIAVIAWYRLQRYAWYRYSAIVRQMPNGKKKLFFSTDTSLSGEEVLLYYRTRFQIEFCFRDAKGYTGLMDCQARDKWKLDFAFNASFTSLNVAKVTMKEMGMEYSMSSFKSLMTNIYLVKRIFKASGYTPNRTLISKIFKDLSCLQRIAA